MNRETARWLWIKKIHDGPVIELTRSLFYNEVVVTVGGRIFALWREDYGEPLFWNRSTLRYGRGKLAGPKRVAAGTPRAREREGERERNKKRERERRRSLSLSSFLSLSLSLSCCRWNN